MNLRSTQITGSMCLEERARVIVALDHDSRQPQHAIEMGLRNLRLITSELGAELCILPEREPILQRMKAELSYLQVAVRQVVDIQQDLIDAIRLELDDTEPTRRRVAVGDVIERVVKSNRVFAGSIEVRGVLSRLSFFADERWIERVLNNLIANAVWHSGGTRILVAARRRGPDIVFEVRDNGRGMTPELVSKVFEPLKVPQLSPIGYPAAQSGLGLYNVRLFTERLGGSVHCSSAPQKGTVFRVRLPGPVTRTQERTTVSMQRTTNSAENKFVAILGDEPDDLRSTEKMFESCGAEVYADHDPLRWLNVITDLNRMPDLVLLDLRHQNGCSLLLDIIRGKWGEEGPKVALMTSENNALALQRIGRLAPVLTKPVTDGALEALLQMLAGERQMSGAGLV